MKTPDKTNWEKAVEKEHDPMIKMGL